MKANTMVATPSAAASAHFGSFAALHGISKASGGRISKPASTTSSASEAEEMHACFSLLKTLVPTVRPSENISKTELLQHVIDYISELSATLAEANRDDADEEFGDENTDPMPMASVSASPSDAESEISN